MATIIRKRFTSMTDAIASQKAESYILGQRNGAGTWPDGETVDIRSSVRGSSLHVTDKIGEPSGPAMRHIELRRRGAVIVTFVFNHFTGELVRTF